MLYFFYYNLLFWSQNLFLGMLKARRSDHFSISNSNFVRAERALNISLNRQSMDERF